MFLGLVRHLGLLAASPASCLRSSSRGLKSTSSDTPDFPVRTAEAERKHQRRVWQTGPDTPPADETSLPETKDPETGVEGKTKQVW